MADISNNEMGTKKRARVDSELGSGSSPDMPESKRVELDSVSQSNPSRVNSENESNPLRVDSVDESNSLRVDSLDESNSLRVDSVNESNLVRVDSVRSESGGIGKEILDILDETDTVSEIQDLDSVIRSFEEEIFQSAPASCTDESQPDLGYLLEASDDELGLPPATSPADNQPKGELQPSYDSFELENRVPSYDSLGYGFGENYEVTNEFLTVGGLFEYPEASDFSEFLWRPESGSLPAA